MSGIENDHAALWLTCAVTGVNFFFTLIPIGFIERWGRRRLLLGSQIGVILSLLLLGAAFTVMNKTAPTLAMDRASFNVPQQYVADFQRCQFSNCDNCVTKERCGACFWKTKNTTGNIHGICLPVQLGDSSHTEIGPCQNVSSLATSSYKWAFTWNYCKTSYPWLPILGMVCYLCSFSIGLAPIPWVMNSEIYPFWARSTGVAAATACNWFANLVISITFLYLTEALTKYGTFFLYAAITTGAWILFYFVVPETRGVSIDEVEVLFGAPRPDSTPKYPWTEETQKDSKF